MDDKDTIQKELSCLCEQFLDYVGQLYSNEKISFEEYNLMRKKKIEFLQNINNQ